MDWRLRVPGALYRRAVDRAGSDGELARRVRDYLTRYVADTLPHQIAARARANRLSPERRSEIARIAQRASVDARRARRPEE